MNFKQLVAEVSKDTNIPAADVRKVGKAILERFGRLIEEQKNFTSPLITLNTSTSKARPATDDKPAVPERKFARMTARSKSKKDSAKAG